MLNNTIRAVPERHRMRSPSASTVFRFSVLYLFLPEEICVLKRAARRGDRFCHVVQPACHIPSLCGTNHVPATFGEGQAALLYSVGLCKIPSPHCAAFQCMPTSSHLSGDGDLGGRVLLAHHGRFCSGTWLVACSWGWRCRLISES